MTSTNTGISRPPGPLQTAANRGPAHPASKQQLLADHTPIDLFMRLGCRLTAAPADLPTTPVTALRARFLDWIPHRRTRLA
ncbi:hypothetical protein [Micromonospora sp. WMMD1274]|uniref:hypothetical protein n=1 Tax=Micromonospora sp. WMMD1274 TaxID=3404116 RepID=UPI003B926349